MDNTYPTWVNEFPGGDYSPTNKIMSNEKKRMSFEDWVILIVVIFFLGLFAHLCQRPGA